MSESAIASILNKHMVAWLTCQALLVCSAAPALAQTAERIGQTVAGQNTVIQRFTPVLKQGSIDITVQDQREEIPTAQAESIRFTLRSIAVEGDETLPASELSSLWQGDIGKEISLADLYRIADDIDSAYLKAGYLSMTIVPVQEFETGHIALQVYESYVETLEISSPIPGIEMRLAPYIEQIAAMRPIRIARAERILLLMSDLGGLDVEGTFLKPDTPTGGGTLKLEIGFQRYAAGLGLDNLGSDTAGPLELSGNVAANDMLGLFETTSLVGVTVPDAPQEMIFLQAGQNIPIGAHGLSAGYDVTYLTMKPGADLKPQDIHIETVIGTARLNYPFIRTIRESLYGSVEINLRNDRVDIMGTRAARVQTRWATLSSRYDRTLGLTDLSAGAQFGQGLNNEAEREGVPDGYRFGRADLDISRRLVADFDLRLRLVGQYSPSALPAPTQFTLGGDPYGWAFDGGSVSGDSGTASALQLSRDFATGWSPVPGVTLTAFADYGIVWNDDVTADYARDELGSTGFGISGMLADTVSFQIVAATPWHYPDYADDHGLRVFYRLGLPL